MVLPRLVAPPYSGVTLGGLAAMAWRRKWLAVVCFFAVGALEFNVLSHLQRRYTSSALVMIDPRQTHVTDLHSIQDGPSQFSDLNYLRSEMQILGSDELAKRVIEQLHLENAPDFMPHPGVWDKWIAPLLIRYGLAKPPGPISERDRIAGLVSIYRSHFSTFNDARSFIIETSLNSSDPATAQDILQSHLAIYLEAQRTAKRDVIRKAEAWFKGELGQLQTKLKNEERSLELFNRDQGLLRPGGETLAARELTETANQLATARADLNRKAERAAQLAAMAGLPGADTAANNSDLIQHLRQQEATATQNVAKLQLKYGPNYAELGGARAELSDIRGKIVTELDRIKDSAQTDAALAQANVDRLTLSTRVLERTLAQTSDSQLTADQLTRNIDADRKLYSDLLLRSKQVAVQAETQEADARIVSAASLSLRPVSPRYQVLFIVGFSFAAAVAVAAAILRDLLAGKRFRSLSDLERETGVLGLAMLPLVRRARSQAVNPLKSGTHLAAAFQTLRNSIRFRLPLGDPRVIVVASAQAGDGKTIVSSLLSRTMHTKTNRVLLVDADLRRCGLSRLLQATDGSGLAEVLRGEQPLGECVRHSNVLGVDVLSAGSLKGDIEAALGLDNVRRVLGELRARYDLVVIDTPPIAAVDDALPFAALADATVLVVRWAVTPQSVVVAAVSRLRMAGAGMVGGLLNATNPAKCREYDVEGYRLTSSDFLKLN